jgi:hypothetical protein
MQKPEAKCWTFILQESTDLGVNLQGFLRVLEVLQQTKDGNFQSHLCALVSLCETKNALPVKQVQKGKRGGRERGGGAFLLC